MHTRNQKEPREKSGFSSPSPPTPFRLPLCKGSSSLRPSFAGYALNYKSITYVFNGHTALQSSWNLQFDKRKLDSLCIFVQLLSLAFQHSTSCLPSPNLQPGPVCCHTCCKSSQVRDPFVRSYSHPIQFPDFVQKLSLNLVSINARGFVQLRLPSSDHSPYFNRFFTY